MLTKIALSWKKSLEIFSSFQAFSQFLLIEIKSIKDAYVTIFRASIALVLLSIIAGYALMPFLKSQLAGTLYLEEIARTFYIIAIPFLGLFILSARPSQKYKDSKYLSQHFKYLYFYSLLPILLIYFLSMVLLLYYSNSLIFVTIVSYIFLLFTFPIAMITDISGYSVSTSISLFIASPLFIIAALFMLDAKDQVWLRLKSFIQALKFLVFNYPFFLIIYLFFGILFYNNIFILNWISPDNFLINQLISLLIITFILLPIYCVTIINFYIKRIHEQPSDYFA